MQAHMEWQPTQVQVERQQHMTELGRRMVEQAARLEPWNRDGGALALHITMENPRPVC